MTTAGYTFDSTRDCWVTPSGEPICAIIFEPGDFDRTHDAAHYEEETLEYLLDWDADDGELPPKGSDERRALVGQALLEAERQLPDMVYELVRDTIRDVLRDLLAARAKAVQS